VSSDFTLNLKNSDNAKKSSEFVRMKRQRRQGTREERSSEAAYWRELGTTWRARTDSRSSRPENVRSARVWHLWATCCVYSQEWHIMGLCPYETRVFCVHMRDRDCVHMRPEYFDGMQMYEDFAVMAALRWDNLCSSACRGWKSSLLRPCRGAVCGLTLCTWYVQHSQEFHTRIQYMCT